LCGDPGQSVVVERPRPLVSLSHEGSTSPNVHGTWATESWCPPAKSEAVSSLVEMHSRNEGLRIPKTLRGVVARHDAETITPARNRVAKVMDTRPDPGVVGIGSSD